MGHRRVRDRGISLLMTVEFVIAVVGELRVSRLSAVYVVTMPAIVAVCRLRMENHSAPSAE